MNPAWTAEDATSKLIDLVVARYGAPEFRRKEFHAYRDLPLAWRMPIMTDVLEGELQNGGLAQFLWNNFHHHRRILLDAIDGYELIGAPAQAAAARDCALLCLNYEDQCGRIVEAATKDQDPGHFTDWYDKAETEMSCPEEDLVYSEADLHLLKGRWILANLEQFRGLLA